MQAGGAIVPAGARPWRIANASAMRRQFRWVALESQPLATRRGEFNREEFQP
jgi:hypothetical protein